MRCRLFQALPCWGVLPLHALQILPANTLTRLFPPCCLAGNCPRVHPPGPWAPAPACTWMEESMGGHGGRRGSFRLHVTHRRVAAGCLPVLPRQAMPQLSHHQPHVPPEPPEMHQHSPPGSAGCSMLKALQSCLQTHGFI